MGIEKATKSKILWLLTVTSSGFKPETFSSVVRCSIQLSYGAIFLRVPARMYPFGTGGQRYKIYPILQILFTTSEFAHLCEDVKIKPECM